MAKGSVARQVAALAWTVLDGTLLVLLVSSRGTGRWVLPKGNRMKGLSDSEAAAVEAREESGTHGRVAQRPVGTYEYWKRTDAGFRLTAVDVYPLELRELLAEYKERGQRTRRWVPPEVAAEMVDEPALGDILRRFEPKPGRLARAAERGACDVLLPGPR